MRDRLATYRRYNNDDHKYILYMV